MPPRRRSRPDPIDVNALRTRLEEGRLVRVGIVGSDQFPDGVVGRVRRIGDPSVDGDEYVFVEVPVNGAKDVLPFGVSDLTAPARRTPAGEAPKKPAALKASAPRNGSAGSGAASAPPQLIPAMPEASTPEPTASEKPAERPAATRPRKTAPTQTPDPTQMSLDSTNMNGSAPPERHSEPSEQPADRAPVSPRPGNLPRGTKSDKSRPKRPPLAIMISHNGEEGAPWRVEAKVGARVAVRSTPLTAARVWEIVQTLGEEKLSAATRAVLDEHRRTAQARADALAAELAAVQAELSTLPFEE